MPSEEAQQEERKFRVVQTVAVYLWAWDEDEAREKAGHSTNEWDDWEMEYLPELSKVELADD